ncbi:MAG: DUF3631 domain-containing protein [Thermoleophilia bacterium]
MAWPVNAVPEETPGNNLLRYQQECSEAFPGSPAERFLGQERGILHETASRFGIGFDLKQQCIVFPYWKPDGSIHRFKLRDKNGQRYTAGEGVIPVGLSTLDGQARVFVCEGETDTLRLAQELPEEAVLGIPGAASIGCLEAYLPKGVTVHVCFDTDKAGKMAIAKAIEKYGARPVILPDSVKDICEYFRAGHSLNDFLSLVADADALAAETKEEVVAMLQTVAEAKAGAGQNAELRDHLAEEISGARRAAYQAPELKKLNGQPAGYLKAVLPDLAALSPIDYSRARKQIAKDGSIPVAAIDAEVIPLKPKGKTNDDGQGSDVVFEKDEPWPWPVDDGAALLDDLAATYSRYCILPEHGAATLALWTVFAYAYDVFYIAPMLALISAVKRCGKTTTLSILSHFLPKALFSSNVTPSSLFRAVELWRPTLLIDEADTFIKSSEELRGIINSGHTRTSAKIIRTEGEGANREPKCFSTWAPKVYAMIGTPPDTIEDRSIVLKLRRKGPGEAVKRIRLDSLPQETADIRRRVVRWTADNLEDLKALEPETPGPSELNDRAADNWRPLLAIADLAGGEWPERAIQAAKAISGSGNDDSSAREMLLADIKQVFHAKATDRLFSADLVSALVDMEDRPWPEWRRGNPLSAPSLAKLLKPFEIMPKTLRIGADRKKGYELADFSETFSRYLPDIPNKAVTP